MKVQPYSHEQYLNREQSDEKIFHSRNSEKILGICFPERSIFSVKFILVLILIAGFIQQGKSQISLTGKVFDDANGLIGTPVNTVDGTGSNAGTIYVNLVNSTDHVVSSIAVASSGTYTFGTTDGLQVSTAYKIILTNGSKAPGTTLTTASLPGNWVSAGEFLGSGAGSDGTVNSILAVTTGNSNITNVNFGIDQLPVSGNGAVTKVNPGGYNSVVVDPANFSNIANSTDPETDGAVTSIRILYYPSNITTFYINGTAYISGTWPANGVIVPATGTGNPTQTITVDPINGATVVDIKFKAIDKAGKESTNIGDAVVTISDLSISGTIYDDANGTTNSLIDGTAIGAAAGAQLYAILVGSDGNVVATHSLNTSSPDGKYIFTTADGVQSNKTYTIDVSTTAPPATTFITPTVGGCATKIQYLSSLNPATPTPLVIFFHSYSANETEISTSSYLSYTNNLLLSNGFIVASSSSGGVKKNGNASEQAAYVALYNYMIANYNISDVYFLCFSMGGLPSLNIMANQTIPCDAWYGISALTNLKAWYAWSPTSVQNAYNFTGEANYAAATNGFDPMKSDSTHFFGIRMRASASATDEVVYKYRHIDSLYIKLHNSVPEFTIVPSTGLHGTQTQFLPDDILNYFDSGYHAYPEITVPAGWVNTAEGTSGSGDGTPNGKLNVTISSSSVSNANFGVDQIPVSGNGLASLINPGGTNIVTVPSTSFTNSTISSDPDGHVASIRIKPFPGNVSSIKINTTTYTVQTFPAAGVIVPAGTDGHPTQTIAIDPNEGTSQVVISFIVIDDAGKESANTGTTTITFKSITGPLSVCKNSSGHVYSIDPITGATGYVWSVPSGATITGGQNSNSITVNFPLGSLSGEITVYATPAANPNPIAHFSVTVKDLPVPTISGPGISQSASPCKNSTGNVYTTEAGMTNYSWDLPPDGTITDGGGAVDNSVTVTWTTAGVKTVSVSYTNANGCSALEATEATLTVLGPTISGDNTSCKNEIKTYTTEPGKSVYSWVALGGTIQSGAGTRSVNIKWTVAGNRSIKVTFTDGTCTQSTILAVTVYQNTPGITTSGGSVLCFNQAATYYTESGNTNYQWTTSSGGSIITGGTPNDNFVTVKWDKAPGSQWVKCLYNPPYPCSMSPATLTVTVNPLPVPANSGECTACQNTSKSYTTDSGKTGYTWTVSGGTITCGAGTSSIVVFWTEPGNSNYIEVNYKNSNGCYAAQPTRKYVTIYEIPVPVINGTTSVKIDSSYTYTTAPGMSNYIWEVNGGKINSGGGTSDATVSITWIQTRASVSVGYTSANNCIPANPTLLYIYGQLMPFQNPTGISDDPGSADFETYPVPNDGLFTVAITNPVEDIFSISIYNTLGQRIFISGNIRIQGRVEKNIDLRPIPPGIYMIVLQNDEKQIIKRIIIEK